MIGTLPTYKAGFIQWVERLGADYGRDATSLDLFEWTVSIKYEEVWNQSLEYFEDRVDLLNLQMEEMEWEFDYMIQWFQEVEEYEKCSRLLRVKEELFTQVKDSIRIS